MAAAGLAVFSSCSTDGSAAGVGADGDTDGDADTDEDSDSGCTPDEEETQEEALAAAIHEADPCFNGWAEIDSSGGFFLWFCIDGCHEGGFGYGREVSDPSQELIDAIEDADIDCLLGKNVGVHGEAASEFGAFMAAIDEAGCGYPTNEVNYVIVVIGGDGSVEEVVAVGEVDPQDVECIETALEGLVFPCLAGLGLESCWSDWE
jgi:hypothetical protein